MRIRIDSLVIQKVYLRRHFYHPALLERQEKVCQVHKLLNLRKIMIYARLKVNHNSQHTWRKDKRHERGQETRQIRKIFVFHCNFIVVKIAMTPITTKHELVLGVYCSIIEEIYVRDKVGYDHKKLSIRTCWTHIVPRQL